MENITTTQQAQTATNYNQQTSSAKGKKSKILVGLLIFVLLGAVVFFAYSWKKENDTVKKYQQATTLTRELAEVVNSEVYRQFRLVDERGHLVSSITCGEIVASNNYQETKPEYVRMVENGICEPFSDVYKPNFTAFTPVLQEKTRAINIIYQDIGVQELPAFDDKPNSNYLFDTCWDIIEAGECYIDTTY